MHALSLLFASAALVALCAAGCGNADSGAIKTVFDPCSPVVLAPDASANAADVKSVQEGADMWNALAATRYGLEAVEGAPRIPVKVQEAAANFHGIYDDNKGVIFINSAITDDHQRAVTVAHELGHSLGLVHIDPALRISVMNSGNEKEEPNEGDRVALVRLWGQCPTAG